MLAELFRALFTVIIFGCTLRSVRIWRAVTSVGYTRAQAQGLQFSTGICPLASVKGSRHCQPVMLIINQRCSFVSGNLRIKFLSSPLGRALCDHVIFANQLLENRGSMSHRARAINPFDVSHQDCRRSGFCEPWEMEFFQEGKRRDQQVHGVHPTAPVKRHKG